MGNRVIASKALKIKKLRARLRIKNAGPYAGWLADYHRNVTSFRRPFQIKVSEHVDKSTRVDVRGESVLERVYKDMKQNGFDMLHRIILATSIKETVCLFFNIEGSCFLTHEFHEEQFVRRSIFYPTRKRALQAYTCKPKRIVWVEKTLLSNLPAMPPS